MNKKLAAKIAVGAMSAAMTLTMMPVSTPVFAKAKAVKVPARVKILTPKVKGTKVQIRWAKAKYAAKYRVYYKVNKGKWTGVTVSGKKLSYTTKSLGYSKVVSVKAAGVNGKKIGKASAVKVVKTAAKPSTKPSNNGSTTKPSGNNPGTNNSNSGTNNGSTSNNGSSTSGNSSSGSTTGKVDVSKIPTGAKNFLYTYDGKKVYVGKTYNTSYWGDKDSNRDVYVTYIPKIIMHSDGYYDGGNILVGVDVNNGGVYSCGICTIKSGSSDAKLGYPYSGYEYDAYGTLQVSGNHKGDGSYDDVKNLSHTAVSWLSNMDESEAIQIKNDDITIVETIDGTAPTLENYHSKWTKASTNGEKFSTYAWNNTTGKQWIRMYEGNKLIYDQLRYEVSGDDLMKVSDNND